MIHRIWAFLSKGLSIACIASAVHGDTLDQVTRSATFSFLQRNGVCTLGTIAKVDSAAITVNSSAKLPVTITRDTLLQVGQGNALLYSARSSWSDVAAIHLYSHEAFVVQLKDRRIVRGVPLQTKPDAIELRHGLRTERLSKADIATVDYLRVKPATDDLKFVLAESPWAVIFYPEFYHRLANLEGKVPVRLYDASKPEDDAQLACRP